MEKDIHDLQAMHDALGKLLQALYARAYAFVTVTPATHHLVNQRPENAWSKNIEDVFGWNRPFDMETVGAELFELMLAASILRPVDHGWQSLVRVSSMAGKLFVHSGFPTDAQDAVFFGPDTYRFMHAVYASLSTLQGHIHRAVDIGSGSGAGAILLAEALPDAEVWGVDINTQALAYATTNAKAAGITNVGFKYSDLLEALPGEFNLIIANPPYLVDPAARAYRHGDGPLGAQLSLDIVDAALTRLTPGGTLMMYTGVAILNGHDPFIEEVKHKVRQAGCTYQYMEIDPDIFGEELATPPYHQADRIAAVWLLVNRPSLESEQFIHLVSTAISA